MTISSRQLAIILYTFMVGSVLAQVPGKAAAQDAGLATLGASLPGLLLLHLLIVVQKRFPGQSLLRISVLSLGRGPGYLLNTLYLAAVFLVTMTYLFKTGRFLQVHFPLLPLTLLGGVLLLSTGYCLYQGLNAWTRLVITLFFIALAFSALGFAFTGSLVSPAELRPFLQHPGRLWLGILQAATSPYAEVVLLAPLLARVNDLQEKALALYVSYAAVVLLFFPRDLAITAVLGAKLMQASRYPLIEAYRLVGFAQFQRLELVFFIVGFSVAISSLLVGVQSLTCSLKDTLAAKSSRPFILPVSLLLLTVACYSFPNDVFYYQVVEPVLPFLTLPSLTLFALLLYLSSGRPNPSAVPGQMEPRGGTVDADNADFGD